MFNYTRMLKECFWDLNFTEDDIRQIPVGTDDRMKAFLMEKILLNSYNYLLDLQIFSLDELRQLLEAYRVPEFYHDHAFRRKNIAEVFFLQKPLLIRELQWIA
jgi:hypothetical protein